MKSMLVFFVVIGTLVALFIVNANRLLVLIPFPAEERFTRPYEAILERWNQDGKDNGYLEVEKYLQSLASDISTAMQIPADMTIKVHYLDSDDVNAFATLGGHVFVNKGLMDVIEDENGLAMILAHEIAHVQHRDPLVALGRGVAIQIFYSYLIGDYSTGGEVMSLGGNLGLLYFGREQEELADEAAIAALYNHYGHVSGYDQLFRLIKEDTSKDTNNKQSSDNDQEQPPLNKTLAEWFSSHPDLQARIDNLSQIAELNGWRQQDSKPIPQPVREAIHGR